MVVKSSALQREIQQSRPFGSAREEAVLSVMKAADVLRGAISTCLEPAGITPQQYNVLRILRGAGEFGLPTLSIGERMIESAPGITRLLDRMEQRGWVSRQRCPKDRRVVYARISAEGRALLEGLDGPVSQNAASTLPELDEAEIEQLIHLLAKLRRGVRTASEDASGGSV